MAHPAPSLQKALSQKFRADQVAVGRAAGQFASVLWSREFRIASARASWAGMRPVLLDGLTRYYTAEIGAGQRFYNACRIAYGLQPFNGHVGPVRLHADQAGKVIDSTGLGMFLHFVKGGAQMMDAYNQAQGKLAAATADLVMQGARDWITAASAADPDSSGWNRITSGTCDWCEERAGQGPTTSDGEWHNYCLCTAEPSFEAAEPGHSLDLSSLVSSLGSSGATDAAAGDVADVADAAGTSNLTQSQALALLGKWVAASKVSATGRHK